MSGFVTRFLDPIHKRALINLFNSKDYKKAKELSKEDRINFLLNLYGKKLKENDGAKYVRMFTMTGEDNRVIYNLVFGTKHWKGLEVMKNAMLKVDTRGLYSFSDRIGFAQRFLVNIKDGEKWMTNAAELIFKNFRGQCVNVEEIHKFVIVETSYPFKKGILQILEKKNLSQILDVTNKKKKYSYPDGCVIQFSK